jgi:hypothetical protein
MACMCLRAVMEHLADACESHVPEFWGDKVSLLDMEIFDPTRIHGPRQPTDIYLLALAVAHAGGSATILAAHTVDSWLPAPRTPCRRNLGAHFCMIWTVN